ncbi:hypothetical protein [Lacrimispora sp.]|uniref:hypothetical protein n=1 Tax=Lacrimispora sp. TaxID=2719234 RepID=UPI0028A5A465|nr:hypothetical protein [Lacrimispora sp.]
MNDFRVLLQAVLDSSGIGKSDIAEVQKVVEKYHLNLSADLNKAELIKTVKNIVPELEKELKKITGIDIKINDTDLLKAINQIEKDSVRAAKAEEKLVDTMERVRGKSEQIAKAEEKRSQLTQNKAINKALEDEYIAVTRINQAINSGTNEAKVETLTASFRGLGLSTEDIQKELLGVNTALKSLGDSSDGKTLISNAKVLETEYGKVENQIKQLTSAQKGFTTESQRLAKINSVKTWADNNSKAMKSLGANVNGVLDRLNNPNLSVTEFKQLNAEFEKIKSNTRDMGLLGKTWTDSFKDMGSKFFSWFTVSGGIMLAVTGLKKMKDSAIELNGAITDLDMATGSSKKQLESYIASYSKLGDELSATVTDVTISGTEWLNV